MADHSRLPFDTGVAANFALLQQVLTGTAGLSLGDSSAFPSEGGNALSGSR